MLFETVSKYIVYFDMDGVLADFEGGTKKDYSFISATNEFQSLLDSIPEMKEKSPEELEQLFKGKQTNPVIAKLKKAYGETDKALYKAAAKEGFFKNLDPYPGAKEMLIAAKSITGNVPNILTAPVQTSFCKKEKEEWMQKHFSGLYDKFICKPEKYEEAVTEIQNNRIPILIDDKEKFIGPFIETGGIGILHKPGDAQGTIDKLVKIVPKTSED